MVEGGTTASISQKLEIKVNRVSTLKKMIFLKLGVNINIPLYQAIKEYC
jgi:DNA-binding CsgD family transcriptional regulator